MSGELLEWAEVHGQLVRHAPRPTSREALAAGRDVILKIDVQGAATVKAGVPEALLIFLVPPSLEALFQRLQSRATETADELELRQRNAAIELAQQDHYDYVVVNEDGQVDATAGRIQAHPDGRAGPQRGPPHHGVKRSHPGDASWRSPSRRRPRETGPTPTCVPDGLGDLEPGEAVVVEFGRRQALGVVLGPAAEPPVPAKPVLARVRSDGPLLPPARPAARGLDRQPLPGAAGGRPAGDAAAGPARAARPSGLRLEAPGADVGLPPECGGRAGRRPGRPAWRSSAWPPRAPPGRT